MDQRWTERVPKRIEVIVDIPEGAEAEAESFNANLEGMFLRTSADLPKDSDLHLKLILNHDGSSKEHDVHARVVHKEPAGVGVMFQDLDVNTIHALRKSLYEY